jgi:hypothetical protein
MSSTVERRDAIEKVFVGSKRLGLGLTTFYFKVTDGKNAFGVAVDSKTAKIAHRVAVLSVFESRNDYKNVGTLKEQYNKVFSKHHHQVVKCSKSYVESHPYKHQ